jgi:hypothetical protein
VNSRQKGKVGEREFASLLREHGYDARRGQQFAGGADSPDVVSDALAWLHVEVKRVQNLNLTDACVQAEGDSGGKPWIVAHRRNHAPWLITMRAEFFFRLLRGDVPAMDATNGTDGTNDGAHGVTRPTTTIFRRDAENDPRVAGATNNQQPKRKKNEQHDPAMQRQRRFRAAS